MKEAEKQKEMFLKSYKDHSDAIFRYCLFRVSDREEALDLTQEVFMKVWSYVSKGENILNIKAFLYKTASNLVIDQYRRRKPNHSLEIMYEESGFEPASDDYDRIIDRLDGSKAILLLSKIPESYREVLFMRYVQELSLAEIGDITGEEENTIAVRVHRGIAKLEEIFNPKNGQ